MLLARTEYMSGAPVAGPLAGLTVLDLSSVVLGPMCGQYLGDMGADVIKVEPPAGDITRGIGVRRSARMGSLFLSNNRNKRSVVLDLKRADGLAAVLRLARRSDVLLHSMRSNAAQRLGISYESLAVVNPGIVYCQVTGFGDDGPYGGLPAYDDIIQALSGMAMLQTVVAGEPRYFPSAIADKVTAVHAAYASAGALLHRERTGKGQHVVVPMMETMVAFNLQEHLGGAAFEPVLDRMGYPPYRQAVRRPFKTRDGYLCVLPYTDVHWRNFLMIFGRADLADDPDYVTVAGRQRNLERVFAAVQAVL
ncbi:MAG: CaiB/BaiF CoA transferase family protein, partial [Lautropia sp.]